MARKQNQDPITGSVKQPFALAVFGPAILFGLLVFAASNIPYYSLFYLLISLPFGLFMAGTMLWMNFFPSLWAKMLISISWSGLWGIVSVRAFVFLFPEGAGILSILIPGTIIFAYLLPVWKPELASFLRTELSFSPKTKGGQMILKYSLFLLPIAGTLGGVVGLFYRRLYGPILLELFLAPISWLLAVMVPFASQKPITPWE
jgi:hypothetical protein